MVLNENTNTFNDYITSNKIGCIIAISLIGLLNLFCIFHFNDYLYNKFTFFVLLSCRGFPRMWRFPKLLAK